MPAAEKSIRRQPSVRKSILRKALRQSFILATAIIVTLSVLAFLIAHSALRQRVLSQVSTLAAFAEDAVEESLRSSRENAALFAASAEIRTAMERGGTGLPAFASAMRGERTSILGMALFDPSGRRIAADGDAPTALDIRPQGSVLVPVITQDGWTAFDAVAPVGRAGFLVVRNDALRMQQALASGVAALGRSGRGVFGFVKDGKLSVLYPSSTLAPGYLVVLGDAPRQRGDGIALADAALGDEGVSEGSDENGHQSFIAYRSLPSLGWGLSVQIERWEALLGARRLALSMAVVSLFLLALAGVLASLLAGDLTRPLRELTARVASIGPEHWGFRRSAIGAGDEVEVLEAVITDLTNRLTVVYENLEEEVRKRTEELQEQYVLDSAILESIAYGVVTVGHDGVITNLNPAAAHMLGVQSSAGVGRVATELVRLRSPRGELGIDLHPVACSLKEGRLCTYVPGERISLLRADGSQLPITAVCTPLFKGKEVFGAVLVLQDVAEERKMEELKSEFITLASHQLRTPLSILRWHMDLLQTETKQMNNTQRSSLHEMAQALSRMTNMLNALLQVVRLEGKELSLERKAANLTSIVRESLVEAAPEATLKKVTVKSNLPAGTIDVVTDPILLKVVLQNLIGNAIKYTPAKGTVTVGLTATAAGVRIMVRDTGLGIPKAQHRHIFEKFFRAQNVRSVDTDGSGLGLYIAKMIIDRLGGKITFTSAEGEGTTFTITLKRTTDTKHAKGKRTTGR